MPCVRRARTENISSRTVTISECAATTAHDLRVCAHFRTFSFDFCTEISVSHIGSLFALFAIAIVCALSVDQCVFASGARSEEIESDNVVVLWLPSLHIWNFYRLDATWMCENALARCTTHKLNTYIYCDCRLAGRQTNGRSVDS